MIGDQVLYQVLICRTETVEDVENENFAVYDRILCILRG
jgi:hypothetical protein